MKGDDKLILIGGSCTLKPQRSGQRWANTDEADQAFRVVLPREKPAGTCHHDDGLLKAKGLIGQGRTVAQGNPRDSLSSVFHLEVNLCSLTHR